MPSLKNPKADLRKLYNRTIKVSLIVSLAIIIAAFKYSPYSSQVESIINKPQEVIKIDEIVSTIQKPDIPPPPKAPEIIAASIDNIPDDFLLSDIDDYIPIKLPDVPPTPTNVNILDEPFIDIPEEQPVPVGGLKSLLEKLHYTEIAKRAGVEGTVFIQAKIDKNGNVVDAAVLKGLGAGLDEEALNAVQTTKFIPGKQRGRPVNVRMVIPIKFVLK
jgi:periplasmic protein TonB